MATRELALVDADYTMTCRENSKRLMLCRENKPERGCSVYRGEREAEMLKILRATFEGSRCFADDGKCIILDQRIVRVISKRILFFRILGSPMEEYFFIFYIFIKDTYSPQLRIATKQSRTRVPSSRVSRRNTSREGIMRVTPFLSLSLTLEVIYIQQCLMVCIRHTHIQASECIFRCVPKVKLYSCGTTSRAITLTPPLYCCCCWCWFADAHLKVNWSRPRERTR